MDQEEFQRRRLAFGDAVDVYDRIRPTYPMQAVAWSLGLPSSPLVVCDLGAGTGKLTEVLLAAGHEVVAVEPDDAMRRRLVGGLGEHPHLEVRAGTAEAIPLPDASVDAVVAGQAWHWFDEAVVAPEVARVVRPGGTVAAMWNSRDEAVDWVARWSALAEEHAHPTGRKAMAAAAGPDFGAAFHEREVATFRHEQVMVPDDLVALAASRSWTIAVPPPRREALLASIRDLVTTHPALAGRPRVAMPYVVECIRARRR